MICLLIALILYDFQKKKKKKKRLCHKLMRPYAKTADDPFSDKHFFVMILRAVLAQGNAVVM